MSNTDTLESGRRIGIDFGRVFDSEEGRRVLLYILKSGGVFANYQSGDMFQMACHTVRKSFACELASLAGFGAEDFSQLLKEARDQYAQRSGSNDGNGHGNSTVSGSVGPHGYSTADIGYS